MTGVDRSPTRIAGSVGVVSIVVAAVVSGGFSVGALVVNTIGVAVFLWGVGRGRQRAITMGASIVFVGVLVAGVRGVSAGPLLVAVTGIVVGWDTGSTAISIGRQLGRGANTTRIELVHATASVGVGIAAAIVGFGLFRTATGGQPVTALLFLLVAAVLLTWALTGD